MQNLAMIFRFNDVIEGPRFSTKISIEGRALLTFSPEDEQFWLCGVNPAGLGEGGETPENAYSAFRRYFKNVLLDFADTAANATEFRATVQAFVTATDDIELRRWEKARAELRGNADLADGVFAKPPKVQAECSVGVVSCKDLKDGKEVPAVLTGAPIAPTTALITAANEDLALAA